MTNKHQFDERLASAIFGHYADVIEERYREAVELYRDHTMAVDQVYSDIEDLVVDRLEAAIHEAISDTLNIMEEQAEYEATLQELPR